MSQKFKSDIEVQEGLRDSSGSLGTAGQVLSTTGSSVSWVDENQTAHTISNQVKAGVAINKGQAVYATGADGTNIIVGLASNATEATSSKTLGLLDATVSINGFANVIENGKLAGLNTTGAAAGDPVWLGVNGNLIYGLANKPYAPAHLVFIGIVTRVNANNGEIFVNVQNGFELNEIHDVDLKTNIPVNGDMLGYDGTLWINKTIAEWLGYTPANANGTTNYVSKFTGATSLGNSQIFDNGTNAGIGTSSPDSYPFGGKLNVAGNISINGTKIGFGVTDAFTLNGIDTAHYGMSSNMNLTQLSGWGGLVFATNSAERMRITSAGNVGIGTTSPNSLLQVGSSNFVITDRTSAVYGPESQTIFTVGRSGVDYPQLLNFGVNQAGLYSSISARQFTVATENNLVLQPNGGNVGIGTTSPSQLLHVAGNARIQGAILDSSNSAGSSGQVLSSTGSGTAWITSGGGGNISGSGTTNYVTKFTDSDSIGDSQIFDNGTNVGFFTNTPVDKVDFKIDTNKHIAYTSNSFYGGLSIIGLTDSGSETNLGLSGNYVNFFTGATERMRITSAGNVGIGTSSPFGKMTIIDSDRGIDGYGNLNIFTNDSAAISKGGSITFGGNNSTGGTSPYVFAKIQGIKSSEAGSFRGSLRFGTAAASSEIIERMRIDHNGNVGIGTTSPAGKLSIVDGYYNTFFADTSSQYGSGLILSGDAGSEQRSWRTFVKNGNGSVALTFEVSTNGTSYGNSPTGLTYAERMRITSDGNVGIGTSSPTARFQIGDLYRVTSDAVTTWGVTNGNGILSWDANLAIIGGLANTAVQFRANNQEVMRLTTGGNVGIGTTSPNALLDVNGDALINGLTVGRGGGNISTNTAIGRAVLDSNVNGGYNTVFGYSSLNALDRSGNTVVGCNINLMPNGVDLIDSDNNLVVGQYNPDFSDNQVPHIYAPDKIFCPNGVGTALLEIDYSLYTAAFLEYSIYNSAGDQFRAGRFVVAFKGTGTPEYTDYPEVIFSGTTSNVIFGVSFGAGLPLIKLINYESDDFYIRFTSRLLMR